jgi:hypothetical protein
VAKALAEMAASQRSSGGAKGAICFFSTLVAFSDEAVSLASLRIQQSGTLLTNLQKKEVIEKFE